MWFLKYDQIDLQALLTLGYNMGGLSVFSGCGENIPFCRERLLFSRKQCQNMRDVMRYSHIRFFRGPKAFLEDLFCAYKSACKIQIQG